MSHTASASCIHRHPFYDNEKIPSAVRKLIPTEAGNFRTGAYISYEKTCDMGLISQKGTFMTGTMLKKYMVHKGSILHKRPLVCLPPHVHQYYLSTLVVLLLFINTGFLRILMANRIQKVQKVLWLQKVPYPTLVSKDGEVFHAAKYWCFMSACLQGPPPDLIITCASAIISDA